MYTYTWYQWLTFFYVYSFFGWIFESTYVSLKKRRFVNRGFLRIPMLPLYGSGAVMMLWVSLPVRDDLFLVYLSGVIAATALEYVTGSVMEQLFKIRYWDYSNQHFQIKGYICLSSSIAWGFLTILMTEVIQKPVSEVVLAFNPVVLIITVLFVTLIFAADAYESTKTALALGKSLETMTKLKADIEELQARVATLKEEAAEQVFAVKEETAERLAAARLHTANRIASAKWETMKKMASARESAVAHRRNVEQNRLLKQLEEIRAKQRALLPHNKIRSFYHKSLLRGNPGAVSTKFGAALKEFREQLNRPDNDLFNE